MFHQGVEFMAFSALKGEMAILRSGMTDVDVLVCQ